MNTVLPLYIFLFAISFLHSLSAQEQQEKKEAAQKDVEIRNEPEQKETPLPKISLPEFVITGSEQIDLRLRPKQEKDEERIFVPERPTPGSRLSEIEAALSPKQTKPFSKTPSGFNGKFFAGYGFYQTPQFDGWFGQHDQTNSFTLNGYYSSSEGHLKNAQWWKGGAGARARYVMPESSLVLPYMQVLGDFRYGRESYFAYGATDSAARTQVRDMSLFNISLGLGSRYALPYKTLSGFDYTGTATLRSFSLTDSSASTETEFSLSGVATTRFLTVALRGQIEYSIAGYEYSPAFPFLQSGQWFTIRGEAQWLLLPSLQSTIRVQQFFYRGNSETVAAGGRLYPQIEFRYFLTESATMTAGFIPSVEQNTVESLSKKNRYLKNHMLLLPSDNPVATFAGMEVSPADELTVNAKFSYKHVSNYPTFLDTTDAKVWEVHYLSDVRARSIDVSLAYRLSSKQNVTAYGAMQSVKQKNSGNQLPYIPSYSFGAIYHHYFDMGLHIECLAEYVAPSFTGISNTHKNAGYVFTAVKAESELFNRFHGVVEIKNLLNQKYYVWNGYQERTIYFLAGISYHW